MATTTAGRPILDPSRELQPPRAQWSDGQNRQRDTEDAGSWLRILGGGALALFGMRRGTLGGMALAALGGALAYRGAASNARIARTLGIGAAGSISVDRTMTVNATPDELYRFWHNFENLPYFMKYLETVVVLDDKRSHWTARGPLDFRVDWEAETTEDRPGELIAWRSLPGSIVDTEGAVRFVPAPGNRGTEVRLTMRYSPPGGVASDIIARLFGRSGAQEAREDLRRFKRFTEMGEIPTTRGQSSGRGRDPWEETAPMVVQESLALGLGYFSIGLGLAELLAPETVANICGVSGHHTIIRLCGVRELAAGVGIMSKFWPTEWLWARVAGDAMDLALLRAAMRSPGARKECTAFATAMVVGVTGLDVHAAIEHSRGARTLSDDALPPFRQSAREVSGQHNGAR